MAKKWIVCTPINAEEVNNKDFFNIAPSGKVLQCDQHEEKYAIAYKGHEFIVTGTVFREVDEPKFMIGEFVKVNNTETYAEIVEIFWHYQKGIPYYIIKSNGKKLSKRYFEHELAKA